tara:strand:- start:2152 stop:4008 length:1857 start_codon:yes stop_codon:yes gene_type:complete
MKTKGSYKGIGMSILVVLLLFASLIYAVNETNESINNTVEDLVPIGAIVDEVADDNTTENETVSIQPVVDENETGNALETLKILEEIRMGVSKSKNQWLEVPETEKALLLTEKAFEREDFTTALERAKDAQLTLFFETRGRINLLWFVYTFWEAIILGIFFGALGIFFGYKKITLMIIKQRLVNLEKEETAIEGLIEEAQKERFVDNTLSEIQFKKTINQYERRLNKIKQIAIKLRNKRVSILKTEQEMENIKKEKLGLLEKMKKLQKDYFVKSKVSRKKFLGLYKLDKERKAELEKKKVMLQERLATQKGTRMHKIMEAMDFMYASIGSFINKKFTKKMSKTQQVVDSFKDKFETKQGSDEKSTDDAQENIDNIIEKVKPNRLKTLKIDNEIKSKEVEQDEIGEIIETKEQEDEIKSAIKETVAKKSRFVKPKLNKNEVDLTQDVDKGKDEKHKIKEVPHDTFVPEKESLAKPIIEKPIIQKPKSEELRPKLKDIRHKILHFHKKKNRHGMNGNGHNTNGNGHSTNGHSKSNGKEISKVTGYKPKVQERKPSYLDHDLVNNRSPRSFAQSYKEKLKEFDREKKIKKKNSPLREDKVKEKQQSKEIDFNKEIDDIELL